jgi:hypothetical protein
MIDGIKNRVNLKLVFLLFLFNSLTIITFGQSLKKYSIVMLKDSSEYLGIISEENDEKVNIVTKDNHILTFSKDHILSIQPANLNPSEYWFFLENPKKWYSTIGYSTILGEYILDLGMEVGAGIKINPYFQTGLAFSLSREVYWEAEVKTVPSISLQNRVNLRKGATPFLTYDLSYRIVNDYLQEDILLQSNFTNRFDIGYQFKNIRNSNNLRIAVGIEYRKVIKYGYGASWGNFDTPVRDPTYSFSARLGWQF